MSDPLFEIISEDLETLDAADHVSQRTTIEYLDRISSLSLDSLTSTEYEALSHESQTVLRSLQALTKRSYKSIDASDEALTHLQEHVPSMLQNVSVLQTALPSFENAATKFTEKYSRLADNALLDRRKQAMKLADNADRLSSILELPALLLSIISASSVSAAPAIGSTTSANANYATALDLHAHIRRLQRLFPESAIIDSIAVQAESAMREMTSNLIATLRSQSLKLAGGMRLIGLLRRVAPELDDVSSTTKAWSASTSEGSLGAMFLVCRLSNLLATLEALEPLQELADQESEQTDEVRARNPWAAGQQTERYLKRYIEAFREQCFAIISMYQRIFPTSLPGPSAESQQQQQKQQQDETAELGLQPPLLSDGKGQELDGSGSVDDALQKLPPAIATFTLHIVDLLMDTLRKYLPNVRDRASRDSLLTQILYCSASLGRLGGDFSMMLSLLEEDVNEAVESESPQAAHLANEHDFPEPEWVQAMRKHRVQSGRLEQLASGVLRTPTKETPPSIAV